MMREFSRAAIATLLASTLWSSSLLGGIGEAASAHGIAHLTFEDGSLRTVSFDASTRRDKTAIGQISIQDRTPIPNQDVDGTGDPALIGSLNGVDLTARVECLVVDGPRAVIGGRITHADVPRYVGKYVLLFVEDQGRSLARLGWGFYESGVSCDSFPRAAFSPVEVTGGSVKVSP